jgi:hypothetical protein
MQRLVTEAFCNGLLFRDFMYGLERMTREGSEGLLHVVGDFPERFVPFFPELLGRVASASRQMFGAEDSSSAGRDAGFVVAGVSFFLLRQPRISDRPWVNRILRSLLVEHSFPPLFMCLGRSGALTG